MEQQVLAEQTRLLYSKLAVALFTVFVNDDSSIPYRVPGWTNHSNRATCGPPSFD